MNVWIRCPRCRGEQERPERFAGQEIFCRRCRHWFIAQAEPATPADPHRSPVLAEVDPRAVAATRIGETDLPAVADTEPHQTAPGPAQPGTIGTIGRFALRAALGQGGFGRVYRAHDPVLDREVALKVPRFTPDRPEQIARFLREAQASARLRHPNIVAVFETGQAGEDYYIATEFVEGEPLSVRIARNRPGEFQAAQWVRDLARALAYAHGQGVIHRDVKPANIMIDRHGRAQLMDFGLAKRLGEEGVGQPGDGPLAGGADQTQDGTVLGTPAYMAPEQASGDLAQVGPHSDQYSLGVVLFELLTGDVPYHGSPRDVVSQLTGALVEPPHFRDLDVKASAALEAVCRKALTRRPQDRYASAADLAADLDRWLQGRPVLAQRRTFPGLARWVADWARHHATGLVAGVLVCAAFLTAGGVWLHARRQVADARAEALAHHGDFLAERGLRLVQQGETAPGVLFLARAFALAQQGGDLARQTRVGNDLADAAAKLPLPKGPSPFWAESGRRLLPRGEPILHAGDGRCVAFRDDGRLVAFVAPPGAEGPLLLRDARTGAALGGGSFTGPGKARFLLGPNAQLLLRFEDGKWEAFDPVSCASYGSGSENGPLMFSPDGRAFLVSASTLYRLARVRPKSDLQPKDRLRGRPGPIDRPVREQIQLVKKEVSLASYTPQALGADGEILMTSRDEEVQLFDTASARLLTWAALPQPGRGGSISGPLFATCSDDGVRLWAWAPANPHQQAAKARPPGALLPCPGAATAAFGNKGQLLLAVGDLGVSLWDVTTRQPLGVPLRCGTAEVRAWFSPTGEHVLTVAGRDVRLWPLPLPVADRAAAVTLWVQLRTATELVDDDGTVSPLDQAAQEDRRRRLEKMLGA